MDGNFNEAEIFTRDLHERDGLQRGNRIEGMGVMPSAEPRSLVKVNDMQRIHSSRQDTPLESPPERGHAFDARQRPPTVNVNVYVRCVRIKGWTRYTPLRDRRKSSISSGFLFYEKKEGGSSRFRIDKEKWHVIITRRGLELRDIESCINNNNNNTHGRRW